VVDGDGGITRYGRYVVTAAIDVMVFKEEVVTETEYVCVVVVKSRELSSVPSPLASINHCHSRFTFYVDVD
jgi:hypothetical protein